ncbi:ion transporter, putative [Bodo saltans]|uniref:Ion transporter, putative n=1 Tax=Bodo saltans TaxID=75058 RepID=A0A0S4J569_BODSA|nr:ion transporter, putative [Bodo saltans]|eukprot:CUG86373.1 ion transporter, putative [Bodo saltans]
MYDEELLGSEEKGNRRDTRDLIFAQCRQRQQQDLITDIFLLVAVVMRDRCGRIQKHGDVLWDTLMRKKNIQIFCFSCFGLICNICIASILWYNGTSIDQGNGIFLYRDTLTSQIDTSRYYALILLQIALSSSTITCCVLLYQRALMYTQEKRHRWANVDMLEYTKVMLSDNDAAKEESSETLMSSYSLIHSGHRYRLLLEVCLHIIHPIIWLNEPDTQVLYRVLQMAIFIRLYFVANLAFLLSEAYQSRLEILEKNVELHSTGSGITLGLALKMFYFSYPVIFTTILMVGSLAVMGFVMFLAERNEQPLNVSFGSLENAYWFSFVTFTTVGYGDLVPRSLFGRIVAVIIGSSGILITTILSGVIINLAAAGREQRFVSEYLERAQAADQCRDSAARVIQAAFRYYRLRSGDLMMPWLRRKGHKSNFLYERMTKFRRDRWRFTKSISTSSDPVIDAKLNFVKTDVLLAVTKLENHEKTVTATIDNIHQRANDILSILDNM